MTQFLQTHWKKLVVILALGGAFAGGRFSVPDKPAEVRVEEKLVYKDRIVEVEKKVLVEAEAKRVVVYRDRVVKPDGTCIEREVSRSDSVASATASSTEDRKVESEGAAQVSLKLTERSQPWRVGVLAGVDTGALQAPLVLGLSVEHEVVWGLSAGLWATVNVSRPEPPTVGLSVSYRF